MDNCYYEKVGNKTTCIDNELPFSIPSKWMWIRLGELGLFRKGPFGSSLTKEMFVDENTLGRVKVYEQKNAIQKDFTLGKYYISKEKFAQMEGFVVNPGDIIVSCAGTIGEIYVLPNNSEIGIINQALMRIRLFVNDILNYFLLYFDFVLKKEANEKGNGTGMKNIPPFDILKKLLVPIPPINEINRILFFLRNINKNIDFITVEARSLNRLVELTKSKILDDIFGENSRYKSYYKQTQEKLENIASLITKGSTPTSYGFQYVDQGISFVKVENVHDYYIDHTTIRQFITVDAHEFQKRSQLQENDMLFSIAGTIGRICLVKTEDLPANTNQAFAIIRGYDKILIPSYLKWYLTWYLNDKSKLSGHGGGMLNITLNDLKKLEVFFPVNKNDQQILVDRIEKLMEVLSSIS
ncbi:MAG: restriction endonuclease subunit S [Clostridia bacterium]|nr:restriction endonuclease subunit S [Clostridia bacterium]